MAYKKGFDSKYKKGQAVFNKRFGLGIIEEVQPENLIMKVKMLETNTVEPISIHSGITRVIKGYDPELVLPRELKSNKLLREELRRLANIKEVKGEKIKGKKKRLTLNSDEVVDKVLEKLLRGEEVHLGEML